MNHNTELDIFWVIVGAFLIASLWLTTHPQVIWNAVRMIDAGAR